MPAYRTPCPTTEAEHETARWLCIPGNRRISTFLENVHTWYHEHNNTMTEAQISGVERWRQRHNPNLLAITRVESFGEVLRMWESWLDDNEDEDLTTAEIDSLRLRYFERRGWRLNDAGGWEQTPSELPDDEETPRVVQGAVDAFSMTAEDFEVALEATHPAPTSITITAAQAARLMEGEEVALGGTSVSAARPSEPATSSMAGLPVLNGMYTVSTVGHTETYRVHTITYSRNNPGLVGKRVVSHYRDGDWKTFAFMTTDCGLKVWRRYEADSSEQYVVYARQMLKILSDPQSRVSINRTHSAITYMDELRATWSVVIQQVDCRFCNNRLSTSENERANGHDGCQRMTVGTPPAERPSRRAARTPRRAAFEASRNVTLPRQEIHTPSEVDGSWEQ